MPCLLLIITLLFTCGEEKISSSIKMSQIIMNIVLAVLLEPGTFGFRAQVANHCAMQPFTYSSIYKYIYMEWICMYTPTFIY